MNKQLNVTRLQPIECVFSNRVSKLTNIILLGLFVQHLLKLRVSVAVVKFSRRSSDSFILTTRTTSQTHSSSTPANFAQVTDTLKILSPFPDALKQRNTAKNEKN